MRNIHIHLFACKRKVTWTVFRNLIEERAFHDTWTIFHNMVWGAIRRIQFPLDRSIGVQYVTYADLDTDIRQSLQPEEFW